MKNLEVKGLIIREIKFRAKSLEGELIYFELHESKQSGDSEVFYVNGVPCQSGTEQEYTGLKDKNGKDGYDGDIVKYGKIISVIKWHWDGWVLETINLKERKTSNGSAIELTEIIGNINENLELLTKQKKK